MDEAQKSVLDVVRMPVPFQYFHLLNMMVCVNVSFWAYAMAMTKSLLAPVCFFFAALIFIGMLELAKLFSDPFGDDEVDFPVHIWLQKFLENQSAFVEYNYHGSQNDFKAVLSMEGETSWKPSCVSKLIDDRVMEKSEILSAHRGGATYTLVPGAEANPSYY